MLDRGKLLVGTGSTNAPWHFEDDKGQLTGMDITMARILAKGLFDDATKVEFVKQDPAARIPNITTGKVDIVIQFMTISPARAQLVAFSRPYYVEGAALLTAPKGKLKTFKQLTAAGKAAKASVLQNVDADKLVHEALPQAQVMQLDTQANVIQALDSGRVDAAVVDLSTVRWLVKRERRQVRRRGPQLPLHAVRGGDAPGRPRLARLGEHLLHGGDVRAPERDLRRGARGVLRGEAPGAQARLPAHLSRPRAALPGPAAAVPESAAARGFALVTYHFNFTYIWRHFDRLTSGLLLSLELAFVSILIGMVIGLSPRARLHRAPGARCARRWRPTSSSSATCRCSCSCTSCSTAFPAPAASPTRRRRAS